MICLHSTSPGSGVPVVEGEKQLNVTEGAVCKAGELIYGAAVVEKRRRGSGFSEAPSLAEHPPASAVRQGARRCSLTAYLDQSPGAVGAGPKP